MPYQAGTSAQRIRIGLTGLALAFILVLLGSVISRSSKPDKVDIANQTAAQNDASAEPNEPLAELGVAPGGSDTTNSAKNQQ